MEQKVIFHIDVNSAFLSWEAVHRLRDLGESLDLREIPSAIGGDQEKRRGVILARSIPAKAYKVQTGEPIIRALSKCPQLQLTKPNFEIYVKYSTAFIAILKEYSPVVEQCSIDEAFMDMTGTEGLYGDLIALAHRLKERIYSELGFTVNVGISSNKLLAKMASDFEKPYRVHTLFPEEISKKMWPMPVGELFFVGKAAEATLIKLGIKTIGQLAKADVNLLKKHLHKQGEIIYGYANGRDSRLVIEEKQANRGYGNLMTIPYDVDSVEGAKSVLLSLCETVGIRLRQGGVKAGLLSVSLVDTFFEQHSKQKTLTSSTDVTKELYIEALNLFEDLWNHRTPIRQLGVHTSKLSDGQTYQYNLFSGECYEKYGKLDKALDTIRQRYGDSAVMRATFIDSAITPIAESLSKEMSPLKLKMPQNQ
ncbi:DNA polymerase IV [Sporanaerobium hydrogeniformans]|uniref:DNA polymerase IV n=1 Tax=Sporanaerobium hydrogeniformans TaxID=3072179 RepID=A0AC61DFG0_9FIRM|nr:DNA polymerase IV [Sporanaerobium hydrogeniformans]PHV71793.1 DNA polymerase IV [Sporanaerobium hydrogeniformans]